MIEPAAQVVLAHGVGEVRGLPLPGELVLQTGGVVVLFSFLAVALLLFVLPLIDAESLPLTDAESLDLQSVTVEGGRSALIIAGCVVAFISLIDIGLALAVFAGRNWARILLMLSCVVTTIGAFIGNVNGSEAVTLATSLPTVGVSIMVLLALSSNRARQYAVRGRRARKHISGRTYEQAAIGSS